jgi:hypothetical protein
MNMLSTFCATKAADRIAGVDIDQLLRSIGEASANESSTVLFGLLLSAQEVLAQAYANGRLLTSAERTLLTTYRGMNDHARGQIIMAALTGTEHSPRQCPDLALMSTNSRGGAQ